MARFDFLFNELVVESMPRTMTTFLGVMLSVLFGLLFGAVLGSTALTLGRKEGAGDELSAPEMAEKGVA